MTDAAKMEAPGEASPRYEDPLDAPVGRERKVQTFRYTRPEVTAPKAIMKLAQTDLVKGAVQIVRQGGRNNLHSHAGADTFWMVLKGRARFYGAGDTILGEFGPYEGIVTPRGTPYWFESADENEDLELLQVAGYEKGVKDIRTNHEERRINRKVDLQRFSGRLG